MKVYDLGIHVPIVLPMRVKNEVLKSVFIGIQGDTIVCVEKFKKVHQQQSKKFISSPHLVAIPGLVNAHTHLAMTLFRGIQDDSNLQEWLFKYILPLEHLLVTPQFVTIGTEIAAFECIRFGTTTVADMYFFSDQSAKVWKSIGLRGLFSVPYIDGETPEDKALGKNQRDERLLKLIGKYQNDALIRFSISPHAPYTCNDTLLSQAAQFSKIHKVPLQIHLSESSFEVNDSLDKHKMRPPQRLKKLSVLGPRTICAHCVQMNDEDIKLMRETNSHVIFNPDSNLKLASGIAPIAEFLKQGVNVALGTDGAASNNTLNLFQAMNVGAKALKLKSEDASGVAAQELLWMATRGGAQALGRESEIGSIEVGKKADIVLIDTSEPHFQPMHEPFSQLVFATHGLEVDSTIVGGKVMMRGKKFATRLQTQYRSVLKKALGQKKRIAKELEKLRVN